MAGEGHGRNVLVYIDIGTSTWTLLDREIECSYDIDSPIDQAVNKSTTGAAGADYGEGAAHTISFSAHVQSASLDTALDQIMTDIRTQVKTPARFREFEAIWDTYEGNVVWGTVGNAAPNDFYVKSIRGQFDGLPTQTTST